jgi:hypothetical protein
MNDKYPPFTKLKRNGFYVHNNMLLMIDVYAGWASVSENWWNMFDLYNKFFMFVRENGKLPNALYTNPKFKINMGHKLDISFSPNDYVLVNGCKIWVFEKDIEATTYALDELAAMHNSTGYVPELPFNI